MQAPEPHLFGDDGRFPNSRYPALVYRGVATEPAAARAAAFERLFSRHQWPAAWRNGLYTQHHYHSAAHEVLGVYEGWVQARLGGEGGTLLVLQAGDVLVIPAGVAHCNEGQSKDFRVVGAYPRGTEMDMFYGKPGERPRTDRTIGAVPLPEQDPVFGAAGPLLDLWRA
jgi:uncharacterized protein YjlB